MFDDDDDFDMTVVCPACGGADDYQAFHRGRYLEDGGFESYMRCPDCGNEEGFFSSPE